jgi:hypothetical protein
MVGGAQAHSLPAGVHSIMMVKLAQPGEGEGVHALSLSLFHHEQSCVVLYAPAERADTLLLFLLCPYMYSVGPATLGTDYCCLYVNYVK